MSKYSDLPTRVIAAVIGATLIVGGILMGPTPYLVVFLVITVATLWEFYRLLGRREVVSLKVLGTLWGAVLVVLSYLVISGTLRPLVLLTLTPLTFLIFIVKLYDKKDTEPFSAIAHTWLGIIYIALPFSLMHLVAFAKGEYDFQLVFGCLLLHWAHDVGAYFAGKVFGRTPLFQRWSPKKTWEGSAGGLVLTLIVVVIGSRWGHSLDLWQWLGMAMIIVLAGTFGDLVESQFKRSLSIKDSGQSIPGHGGFLDRFDGLLISTPLVASYLILLFK